MKETTNGMNEVCRGKFIEPVKFVVEREFHQPGPTIMFEVVFLRRAGIVLEHVGVAGGLTEERAAAMAESLNRAVGLEISGPS